MFKAIAVLVIFCVRFAASWFAIPDSQSVMKLINDTRLCNLMIDHKIGVTRATSYEVKRLDSDYFEES